MTLAKKRKSKKADPAGALSQSYDWQLILLLFQSAWVQMQGLIRERRLPQVLLLTGARSEDLSRFAMALSAMFFCERHTACGECGRCKDLLRMSEPDFLLTATSEGTLKIADADEFQDFLLSRPMSSGVSVIEPKRVSLWLDVEKCTVQAVNRLLKILEEPPTHAQIILTSSYRGHLLPTLRSRCVSYVLHYPQNYLASHPLEAVDPGVQELMQHFLGSKFPIGDRLASVESFLQKEKKDLSSLLRRCELYLNQQYRRLLVQGTHSIPNMRLVREPMQRLKDFVIRKKIAMNPQLSLESLAMETRKGNDYAGS